MFEAVTILVPTLPHRAACLDVALSSTAVLLPGCRIFVDSRGPEVTIGRKRAEMLRSASTEVVLFLDDDDVLLEGAAIAIQMLLQDQNLAYVKTKMEVYNAGRSVGVRPSTAHLWPIRRDIAAEIGFWNLRHREDTLYGLELEIMGYTSALTDTPSYRYLWDGKEYDYKHLQGSFQDLEAMRESIRSGGGLLDGRGFTKYGGKYWALGAG